MNELTGMKVIVTGAAGSLGEPLCQSLHESGAIVAAIDIDGVKLERVENIQPYACDLTDYDAVRATFSTIEKDMGGIDALINNAGIIRSKPLVNILSKGNDRLHSFDDWTKVISSNLTSTFNAGLFAAEMMIQNRTKGVIVNVSSIASQGNPGQSAYSAAKAGVDALTKTWSKELGLLGIRCVGVSPGFMDTPSTKSALTEDQIKKTIRTIPLRRLGEAHHVIDAILFALKHQYLTGTILEINGGCSV